MSFVVFCGESTIKQVFLSQGKRERSQHSGEGNEIGMENLVCLEAEKWKTNTWSPLFWQGQAIYAGPAAPEMTGWDWEQEEVGNTVRKARGHLRREFQRSQATSRRMESDITVVEKLKLERGGLVRGWDKSGKSLFLEEREKKT